MFIGYIGTDSIGLLIKRFAAKKAGVEDGRNQQSTFLMARVNGGIDNGRQKTRNHGYDVIVGGELFTDYPDHPRNQYAKPKTQINMSDATSFFPVGGMHGKQLGLKDFSPKVRTLWHCSRLRSVALLPMIDS